MNVLITFTTIGVDAGPFNLYSNVDGFTAAFEVGVTSVQLLAGFPSASVPNGTTIIRAQSVGVCNNHYDMVMPPQTCYRFLPLNVASVISRINGDMGSFYYGSFTSYEESSIVTPSQDLIKLNIDLSIDHSFEVGVGFNEILYSGSHILQQPDGKIIATGTFTNYQGVSANRIIRLETNGDRDLSFVIGTGLNNFTQSPGLDSLGRVIITGIFDNYNGNSAPRIARVNPDGSFDNTLVMGTGFNNTTLDVIVEPDDSLIVVGYFDAYKGVATAPGIAKIDVNGTIDPSFVAGAGFSPYLANNARYMARIAGETSFYVAGYFTSYKGTLINRIVKIDEFGSIDPSFNPGTGFNSPTSNIEVMWGNKLLIVGAFTAYNGVAANRFIVLNADGTILYTPGTTLYYTPIILGDNLFAQQPGLCLEILFTKP